MNIQCATTLRDTPEWFYHWSNRREWRTEMKIGSMILARFFDAWDQGWSPDIQQSLATNSGLR
jgi:hypothetical protein